MYFFWLCLMGSQPYLLIFGLFGFLGKDAESAAEDICEFWGCLLLLAIVVFAGYKFLQWIGLLT